jgi:hypothetical protein
LDQRQLSLPIPVGKSSTVNNPAEDEQPRSIG